MSREASYERDKWNRRYRERGLGGCGGEPTPWLADHRHLLNHPGGTALDLACGNGKNSFFLASLDYRVDALDISDVAVAHIQTEAQRHNANVTARRENLRTADLPNAEYDVVVCFRYLERRLFPMIEKALRPGGLVFIETFTRRDPEISGKAFPPELLLDEGELKRSFPTLEIVAEREEIVALPGKEPRALASLVARRPAL